jgi:hypothetical protein
VTEDTEADARVRKRRLERSGLSFGVGEHSLAVYSTVRRRSAVRICQ